MLDKMNRSGYSCLTEEAYHLDRAIGEAFLLSRRATLDHAGGLIEQACDMLDPSHFRLHINLT